MKLNVIITTIAILIVLCVLNYLISRHPVRLDLTQNNVYTLSDATEQILDDLDDVLTVRVYFSKKLPPALQAIRRDVDDLLDEYRGAAGNKFRVEHIDPASSAMEERKVAMMGIPPLQINVIERDKQEVAKIYLGMAVLYGGKQQIIPVVQHSRNLEYLLDEAILKVSSTKFPKIAWWQPLMEKKAEAEEGEGKDEKKVEETVEIEGAGYGIMLQALSQRYEVEDVSASQPTELSPEEYSSLIILAPEVLGDEALEMIDGYLAKGGKVIALVNRWKLDENMAVVPVETDITGMLTSYGVTVEDSIVLDELNARAAFTGGVVTYHIPYPYWPDVNRTGLNQNLPISSDLESVVLPWSSPLKISELAQPEGHGAVVAMTSDNATAIPGTEVAIDPKIAAQLLEDGNHHKSVLMALLEGPFVKWGKGNAADSKAVGSGAARLFVSGSAHWITDRFIAMFPQNAVLFQNAVDYFAMGDVLIGIRSRESVRRPTVPVPDAARFWFKYLNVATGPIAVGIIGLIVFLMRRFKRRSAIFKYS